jgi:hypothetical protein
MTKWILEHKETIGILLMIGAALLAGVAVGFMFIILANLWMLW